MVWAHSLECALYLVIGAIMRKYIFWSFICVFLIFTSLILAIIAWAYGDIFALIMFVGCIVLSVIAIRLLRKAHYHVWNHPLDW